MSKLPPKWRFSRGQLEPQNVRWVKARFKIAVLHVSRLASLELPTPRVKGFFKTVLSVIKRVQIFVIILDGLDECTPTSSIQELLSLFSHRRRLPIQLRVLITSRPEPRIRGFFETATDNKAYAKSYAKSCSYSTSQPIVGHDMYQYLERNLRQLPETLHKPISPHWPFPGAMRALVRKSGLSVFTRAAVRFIGGARVQNPQNQQASNAEPQALLDELYLRILRHAEFDDTERYRWVMGCVALGRSQLTLAALSHFTGCDENAVSGTLDRLRSVVAISSLHEISIYHSSFIDFVTDPARCKESLFAVDVPVQERRIVLRCFELMMKNFKMDGMDSDAGSHSSQVQDVETMRPFKGIFRVRLPDEVQYSCMFWTSHLSKVACGDTETVQNLNQFVSSCLVNWLHVFHVTYAITTATSNIREALCWALESKCSRHVIAALHDTYRCLLSRRSARSSNVSQNDETMLPSTSCDTLVSQEPREDGLSHILHMTGPETVWSPCLTLARKREDEVKALDFSADGSCVAVGTAKGVVSLWNFPAATLRVGSFKTDSPLSLLVFVPDTLRVCTVADDGQHLIIDWDSSAGAKVHSLRGHTDRIECISASPNGARLASASLDCTVKIWDMVSGTCITTLRVEPESAPAHSVAFMPNSSQLLAGYRSGAIRLWDVQSVTTLSTFEGQCTGVCCIAVSADGQYLASGGDDHSIWLFDIPSGIRVRTMADHTSPVLSVCFSPLDQRLTSGSADGAVFVWNWETGDRQTSRRHSSAVNTIRCSLDGSYFATGSSDSTWIMWDALAPSIAERDPPANVQPTFSTVWVNGKSGFTFDVVEWSLTRLFDQSHSSMGISTIEDLSSLSLR